FTNERPEDSANRIERQPEPHEEREERGGVGDAAVGLCGAVLAVGGAHDGAAALDPGPHNAGLRVAHAGEGGDDDAVPGEACAHGEVESVVDDGECRVE